MGTRHTRNPGHLRRALMATTPITRTPARLMATMGLAGFRADSSSASDPGAGVDAASTADVATAAMAGAVMVAMAHVAPTGQAGIAVG
jgi:hypothetical protein